MANRIRFADIKLAAVEKAFADRRRLQIAYPDQSAEEIRKRANLSARKWYETTVNTPTSEENFRQILARTKSRIPTDDFLPGEEANFFKVLDWLRLEGQEEKAIRANLEFRYPDPPAIRPEAELPRQPLLLEEIVLATLVSIAKTVSEQPRDVGVARYYRYASNLLNRYSSRAKYPNQPKKGIRGRMGFTFFRWLATEYHWTTKHFPQFRRALDKVLRNLERDAAYCEPGLWQLAKTESAPDRPKIELGGWVKRNFERLYGVPIDQLPQD